jgi:hypothetical protein
MHLVSSSISVGSSPDPGVVTISSAREARPSMDMPAIFAVNWAAIFEVTGIVAIFPLPGAARPVALGRSRDQHIK